MKNNRKYDVLFVALFLIDLSVRLYQATHNNHFDTGDLLAPFSIIDTMYHNEHIDIGRQQWLLPEFISFILHVFHVPNNFIEMLHVSNAVTAIASSATLIPLYVIARHWISAPAGLWATLLLMTNAMFSMSSFYFNPTQVYVLILTSQMALLLFCDKFRTSTIYWIAIAVIAGLSYAIRHEGILLIIITMLFALFEWKKGGLSKKNVYICALLLIAFTALNWIIRAELTISPLSFLQSTAAQWKPFEIFTLPIMRAAHLIQLNLNFRLEKMVALVVNITILGALLAPMGYIFLRSKMTRIHWLIVYWVIYECAAFSTILFTPITDTYYLKSLYEFRPDPSPRYYQVFTPFLMLLAYGGVLMLLSAESARLKYKKIVAHCLIILFMVHQLALGSQYFKKSFLQFDFEHADFIAVGQYFRDMNIRNANILYLVDDEQHIQFSILSGGNTVNCWDGRPDPRYDCLKKYSLTTLKEVVLSGKEKFDYLITNKQLESPFAQSAMTFKQGDFKIYKL